MEVNDMEVADMEAAGWFRCRIDRVGPADDGRVYVWLTDGGGQFSHWFYAIDSMKREMLATGLTAMSTGKVVDVFVADTVEYSQVNRMYLIR